MTEEVIQMWQENECAQLNICQSHMPSHMDQYWYISTKYWLITDMEQMYQASLVHTVQCYSNIYNNVIVTVSFIYLLFLYGLVLTWIVWNAFSSLSSVIGFIYLTRHLS